MQIHDDTVTIVAELGGNVGQNIEKGKDLVMLAAWAGASAVKVQLYEPDQMTIHSDAPGFVIPDGPWGGHSLWDLYTEGRMPHEYCPELMEAARSQGMGFIASVFHPAMVEVAERYGIETYKVASYEIGYKDLLVALRDTGKPVILSTGMADGWEEIADALDVFAGSAVRPVLLKCTSQYPAPMDQMNLLTIPDMRRKFGCRVGLSDHTTGLVCPIVAATLGACMIEKHLKFWSEDGLDAAFSLPPAEFQDMVRAVRQAEESLGLVDYDATSTQFKRRYVEGHGWIRMV